MQIETPALGIMKTADFGDTKFYKVTCQCSNYDDDIDFEISADEHDIVVNTTFSPKSSYWCGLVRPNTTPMIKNAWLYSIDASIRYFINSIYHRISVTTEVWMKGYVKVYQTTIMSEQQALNYANTLQTAVAQVKEFRDARKEHYHNEGC